VWDADTGKPLFLIPHAGITSVSFSADGRRILTGGEERTARVWDAETGMPLASPLQIAIPFPDRQPLGDGSMIVGFSSDSRRVLTLGPLSSQVWDLDTGKAITPRLQFFDETPMAFSPDGQRVLTRSMTGRKTRVLDSNTGKLVSPPLQHDDISLSATFSPDGRLVLIGSGKSARLWDVESGKALSPPLQHASEIRVAAFSPDGRRVLTGCIDGTNQVWDVSPDDRPVADIVGLAELWSMHRIDDTGTITPLTADEQFHLWNELQEKYPGEFIVSPQSGRRWREGEIRDCMKEGNIRAAQFHYWALFEELSPGRRGK
jgi:WD40 repeat protein